MQLAYVSAARRPTHTSMNSAVQHFLGSTIFLSKPLFPLSRELKDLAAAEPIKLQRLLATLSQHSPVRHGPFYTKHTFEKAQMRILKGAVKLTTLLHEPCSPDLASKHTGGDSVAFSQPKESMWPVI